MRSCLIVALLVVLLAVFAPWVLVAGGVLTLGGVGLGAWGVSQALPARPAAPRPVLAPVGPSPAERAEDEARRRQAEENGRQILQSEEADRLARIEAERQANERLIQARQAEVMRQQCLNIRQAAIDYNRQHAGQPGWPPRTVQDCPS